jgi:signal transduction histidine kinase
MEAEPQSDGIGLIGIQERLNLFGGSLQIESQKGQGATLTACVPWPAPVEKP